MPVIAPLNWITFVPDPLNVYSPRVCDPEYVNDDSPSPYEIDQAPVEVTVVRPPASLRPERTPSSVNEMNLTLMFSALNLFQ